MDSSILRMDYVSKIERDKQPSSVKTNILSKCYIPCAQRLETTVP